METAQLNLNQDERLNISKNLNYLMRLKNLNESKISQELNIPVMTIRRLLSGETTDPRVFTLKTLADYLNVTIDALISTDGPASNKFMRHAKPIFIPILSWESGKSFNQVNLKEWQDWIPVTMSNDEVIGNNAFALESRPSMYPRYPQGTIFILDPNLNPTDGDLVLVNIIEDNELTLRELFIDPPEWQLHPLNPGAPILQFSKERHQIMAVVSLTLFHNRRKRHHG